MKWISLWTYRVREEKSMEGRFRWWREDEAAEDIKGWEKGHTISATKSVRHTYAQIYLHILKQVQLMYCGIIYTNA